MATLEKRQGLKVACIEEIAYTLGIYQTSGSWSPWPSRSGRTATANICSPRREEGVESSRRARWAGLYESSYCRKKGAARAGVRKAARAARIRGGGARRGRARYHARRCGHGGGRPSRPDVVLNCAAYNQVDDAERDATTAFLVNAQGVRHLAVACRETGAFLVHYGTDYVFNGRKETPYTEDDEPDPINAYGKSKLRGSDPPGDAGPVPPPSGELGHRGGDAELPL